jgi:alpha 1,2-mannosyltransferase
VVLRRLKRLGTDLPIEVFHYPDELLDQSQRAEIESFGARIVEIQGVSKQSDWWKNWQIKGLAIVQSSFQEVLYLDSGG